MIDQPARGDGETAWRQYASELRQALGAAHVRVAQLGADVRSGEKATARARTRARSLRSLLNQVQRLLEGGHPTRALNRIIRWKEQRDVH